MRQNVGIATHLVLAAAGLVVLGWTHAGLTGESCLTIVERAEAAILEGRAASSARGGAPAPAPEILLFYAAAQHSGCARRVAPLTRTAPQSARPAMKMADGMGRVAPPSPSPLPEAGIVERDRFAETDLNGVIRTSDQPISTFSADVDTASMGIVRRFIRDGAPPADAVQVEELVNYFDYNYPRPESAAKPFAPSVHLMPSPWGQGRELMVVGIRGWAPQRAKLPPANVVLLADVSGSMRGPDRLDLVKRSMAVLVDQLNGDDHVALVTYAGAAQLQPIADDVKFQVEFNPAQVAEYRLVGYETRMLREEDFANDAVDAGEIGDGHRVTAI